MAARAAGKWESESPARSNTARRPRSPESWITARALNAGTPSSSATAASKKLMSPMHSARSMIDGVRRPFSCSRLTSFSSWLSSDSADRVIVARSRLCRIRSVARLAMATGLVMPWARTISTRSASDSISENCNTGRATESTSWARASRTRTSASLTMSRNISSASVNLSAPKSAAILAAVRARVSADGSVSREETSSVLSRCSVMGMGSEDIVRAYPARILRYANV